MWRVTARIDGITSQEEKSRILVPLALFLYLMARLFSVGYLFFPVVLSFLILTEENVFDFETVFVVGKACRLLFVTSIQCTPVTNTLR